MANSLDIVIGIITDASGKILIARRREDVHLGGLWEFPGGKFDNIVDRNYEDAVKRELKEELGIEVIECAPMMHFEDSFDNIDFHFYIFDIMQYRGDVTGAEGQPIEWVNLSELANYSFPDANQIIIKKLSQRAERPA